MLEFYYFNNVGAEQRRGYDQERIVAIYHSSITIDKVIFKCTLTRLLNHIMCGSQVDAFPLNFLNNFRSLIMYKAISHLVVIHSLTIQKWKTSLMLYFHWRFQPWLRSQLGARLCEVRELCEKGSLPVWAIYVPSMVKNYLRLRKGDQHWNRMWK